MSKFEYVKTTKMFSVLLTFILRHNAISSKHKFNVKQIILHNSQVVHFVMVPMICIQKSEEIERNILQQRTRESYDACFVGHTRYY